MKHYIISEEQRDDYVAFLAVSNRLAAAAYLAALKPIKRLSDEEIDELYVKHPDSLTVLAHAIMDKLGVPNA